MLVQAMIGSVSPNFRMIELAFENGKWVIRVTLASESQADREEVDEICDEMSVFLDGVRGRISDAAYSEITADIVVSQAVIYIKPQQETRLVFRRREH